MKKNYCKGLIIFLVIATNAGFSQTGKNSFPLSTTAIKELIDSLASKIEKYYIFNDTALQMSKCIRTRLQDGKYNNIEDPNVLAGLLTNDVYSVYHDEHFNVEYNSKLSNELENNIKNNAVFIKEQIKKDRLKNFGFKEVKILNGNIGYLNISAFCSLNQFSKETAKAALKMLSNSDAIIIDLRYGLGGSPEMVNYIASAFFKEKTYLADIYIRYQKINHTYWTEPDSTFYPLSTIPLYILTSYKTFSAAEGLSYELQKLNRATIIGEVTRGGAHTTIRKSLGYGFTTDIPCGRATIRTTNSNWERKGVIPDSLVSAGQALEIAELKILEDALAKTKDTTKIKYLNWQLDIIKSINNPFQIDSLTLLNFSGVYGPYTISYSNGSLYYQKTGKAKFPLIPMAKNMMKAKGNDTFKVEFIAENNRSAGRIITYYDDGRIEYANRSKQE